MRYFFEIVLDFEKKKCAWQKVVEKKSKAYQK